MDRGLGPGLQLAGPPPSLWALLGPSVWWEVGDLRASSCSPPCPTADPQDAGLEGGGDLAWADPEPVCLTPWARQEGEATGPAEASDVSCPPGPCSKT